MYETERALSDSVTVAHQSGMFLWANGISEALIGRLHGYFDRREIVPEVLNGRFHQLVREYIVVGGMPAAVQKFLDTKDIRQVVEVQKKILVDCRKDITQYDEKNSLRIRAVFDRLAPELNKKNKRFFAGNLDETSRFDRLEDEFVWLKEAGVVVPSYSVSDPKVPLVLSQKPTFFKLFMNDVGLLAAMYMDGIQLRIVNGEQEINFGAVYENFVAQELKAHGFEPTYYNSKERGELDFVIEDSGTVLPIEVKCGKHHARHRALNNLLAGSEYAFSHAIVFDDDALKTDGRKFYAPVYMAMFLHKTELPEKMTCDLGAPIQF